MRSLLLVGAGHAHVALLEHASRLQDAGFEVELVDPGSFWYGGAPARLIGGDLGRVDLRLPLHSFCRAQGVRYRANRAIGLDARHRRLWLATGEMLEFDTVSLDVGYEIPFDETDAAASGVQIWKASAPYELVQFVQALDERPTGGRPQRIAVTGDGPRATEIVAGLAMGRRADDLQITWFLPGSRPLPAAPTAVNRRVARLHIRRGVELISNTSITGVAEGAVCSVDGRRFAADHVVVAAGARAARFAHAAGLPASSAGLKINWRLQALSDTRIYAVGGCAELAGRNELRLSDALEQGRILARNIVAGAQRRPFKSYRPGGRGEIVDLGDGSAIGWRGRFWWHGNALLARRRRSDAEWLTLIERHTDSR
ncbi:pyridine nucleotide-disulfide oxidoreductase [Salinisphaera dokdonensis CL-ES53]|uniref:Pyridine nucleotide-disulfide oxidoreductase n=1 Tax=Salinisphaera dokdonensis CL-ES53 TaxID=1304272 RepID=A0ABV2AWA2_9GAMM